MGQIIKVQIYYVQWNLYFATYIWSFKTGDLSKELAKLMKRSDMLKYSLQKNMAIGEVSHFISNKWEKKIPHSEQFHHLIEKS